MDQLAMANSVCWYGHVLRKADSHVLRRALGLYLCIYLIDSLPVYISY